MDQFGPDRMVGYPEVGNALVNFRVDAFAAFPVPACG